MPVDDRHKGGNIQIEIGVLTQAHFMCCEDRSRNEQVVVSSPRVGLKQVIAGIPCKGYPRPGRVQLCQQSRTPNAYWYGKRGGNGSFLCI